MQLEKQVCNLELSKQLKELGVKQESLWFWIRQNQTALPEYYVVRNYEWEEGEKFAPAFRYYEGVSAFTVAELGEMLPTLIKSYRYEGNKQWCANYETGARLTGRDYPNMESATEADARAKMLIYLTENKLI